MLVNHCVSWVCNVRRLLFPAHFAGIFQGHRTVAPGADLGKCSPSSHPPFVPLATSAASSRLALVFPSLGFDHSHDLINRTGPGREFARLQPGNSFLPHTRQVRQLLLTQPHAFSSANQIAGRGYPRIFQGRKMAAGVGLRQGGQVTFVQVGGRAGLAAKPLILPLFQQHEPLPLHFDSL